MMLLFQACLNLKTRKTALLVSLLFLVSGPLNAAGVDVIHIDKIIINESINKLLPYAINIASHPKKIDKHHLEFISKLNSNLVYISKVKVDNDQYFRLVSGNFKSRKEAVKALAQYKKYYKEAWVNYRGGYEITLVNNTIKQLADLKTQEKYALGKKKIPNKLNGIVQKRRSITEAFILDDSFSGVVSLANTIIKIEPPLLQPKKDIKRQSKYTLEKKQIVKKQDDFAQKLLAKIEASFLDGDFSRVISGANKVIEIGNPLQQQKAMELMGVARERQGKFAQAIAVYNEFLQRFPNSLLKPKIKNRLIGLKTMRLEPKKRLVKRKRKMVDDGWISYGSLSQYYRNDVIDDDIEGSRTLNSSLISDLNIITRKNDEKTRLAFRFDGGVVNDFIDDSSDLRISRAMLSYTNKESNYKVVSGRQSRTAKGVLGRFDGFVFTQFSDTDINYSLFTGFPVLSSLDSVNTDSQFYGGSVNFKYNDKLTADVYLVQQNIDGLIDRQAIGTEVQYLNDKGFFYGILDYDVFYAELNNITLISNYRQSDTLSFNITLDHRNAPLLTTLNALQGQAVESIQELRNRFTKDEIYNLARDRTSKSTSIFFGSNYQIDSSRQLYTSVSFSSTKATKSSAGVIATPDSDSLFLSVDYTIKNYFNLADYSTIGARLSQSTSSETFSINSRTQFSDYRKIRYKPKFNIDYRRNINTDVSQWILKPSLKMSYKYNKKVSFEGEFGMEFSDFILPEQEKQTAYSLFVGYLYQFD